MKKQPIVWFYPVFGFIWFLVVVVLMLFFKISLFWAICAYTLLLASEVPIILFKKKVHPKNRAEMDSYILYILGTGSYCFPLMTKLIPVDYIFAFVAGISGILLLILKMHMLDTYTRAVESP